jgi:hypothetical protein
LKRRNAVDLAERSGVPQILPDRFGGLVRCWGMPTIEELRLAMERAAAAMDFEEAGRLRDQISLLRLGDGDAKIENIDPSGLTRQQPGAMGLGTSQQSMTPPAGWVRPNKPDPLTANGSRRSDKNRSRKRQ